jgi:hypothetical protein
MDAALNQLRAEGHQILAEDVARLSPLSFKHINMLGRYAFTLPNAVTRKELRPCGIRPLPQSTSPNRGASIPYVSFLFRCYSDPG